jgi:hypothetical protein
MTLAGSSTPTVGAESYADRRDVRFPYPRETYRLHCPITARAPNIIAACRCRDVLQGKREIARQKNNPLLKLRYARVLPRGVQF